MRIIVPAAPGGGADIIARLIGQQLGRSLGQTFLVDNRPGAANIVGTEIVAKAQPDGYTLCILSNQGLVANEFLYKTLPYSRGSFSPIMNLFYNTQVIVVSETLHVKSLEELAVLAKAKPGTLNYIVPGIFQRVFFDRFNKKYGTDLVAIPFKGGGDVITGILSGVTPIAFIGGANFEPYVREGKMVALAVDADERSPLFPDAPTLTELGYKDSMPRTYLALVVPAGASQQIIAKVHDDVAGIMNEPDFRKRHVTDRGLEPVVDTPAQFAQFLERDRVATGALVKEAGVAPQ